MQPIRDNARILTAAMVGTAIEFYDFFIFGTAAALVFGPLFFPKASLAAQSLFAFMTFGVAFFARPVGAVFFGHWGDRFGRKNALIASLLLMGLSTLAIAFLPTYAMAGWIAPALLCLLRIGQGLALGGQWGGAALLAVENAPAGWEGRFVSIMQLGSPLGVLGANGLFLLLSLAISPDDFTSWGWRVPFLFSVALVGLSAWMRARIEETPEYSAALAADAPAKAPLAELLRSHMPAVVAAASGVICTFALFYLTTVWALSEGVKQLGYSRDEFIIILLIANLFYAGAIIAAGVAADRTRPGTVMAIAAAAAVPVGLGFGWGLHEPSRLFVLPTMCITMFVLGWVNAPQGAWMSRLFPVRLRFSGVALGFNIGGIIGGAFSPYIAEWLSHNGMAHLTGLLISIGGACTCAGVLAWRKRQESNLPETRGASLRV